MASTRRSDSPATSSKVCAQSSRSGTWTKRGYVARNWPNSLESAGTHKMAAEEGSSERSTFLSLPSRRSEEHTSELQSRLHLVCRLLLEKKKIESPTRISMVLQTTARRCTRMRLGRD